MNKNPRNSESIFLYSRQSFLVNRYNHSLFLADTFLTYIFLFFFFGDWYPNFQYDWNYPNRFAPHPRGIQRHCPWYHNQNYHT